MHSRLFEEKKKEQIAKALLRIMKSRKASVCEAKST